MSFPAKINWIMENPIHEIKDLFSPNFKSKPDSANFGASDQAGSDSKRDLPKDAFTRYQEALTSENWGVAAQLLEEMKNEHLSEDEWLIEFTKIMINLNNLEKAQQLLKSALAKKPKYALAYFLMGRLKYHERNYFDASEYIGKAIRLDQSKASFWYWHGVVLRKNGLLKEAGRALTNAHKIAAMDHQIIYLLGVVYFEMHQFQDAIETFQLIENQPSFCKDVCYYMANSYKELKLPQAEEYYARYKELQNIRQ